MIHQLCYEFRLLVVSWILDLLLFVAPKEREGIVIIRGVYFIASELSKVQL